MNQTAASVSWPPKNPSSAPALHQSTFIFPLPRSAVRPIYTAGITARAQL